MKEAINSLVDLTESDIAMGVCTGQQAFTRMKNLIQKQQKIIDDIGPKWVSVADDPKEEGYYFVSGKGSEVGLSFFDGHGVWLDEDGHPEESSILCWQEMPKPPNL